ncbi:hypothetical protein HRH25_00755 [Flavisolibacter sp. BT320]|nr:hypothetical protein [Flavisolibacter longurius]
MASTFWVELYFRSLNPNSVFKQLTNYLLQYRQVSIPSVGTIRLVQQPAQLDVADKIITPPSYTTAFSSDETVSEHQLAFLSAALQEEKSNVMERLSLIGERLREKIDGNGFDWKGIGWIGSSGESGVIAPGMLQPVRAERVLRQNAEHNVLVGDQELTSRHLWERKEAGEMMPEKKRSVFMIVGWIMLALAILFIVFMLYQGKFRIGATGSRQSPTSYLSAPSYQYR